MIFQQDTRRLALAALVGGFIALTSASPILADDKVVFTADGPVPNDKFKNVLTVYQDGDDKLRFERVRTIVVQDRHITDHAYRTPTDVCDLIPGTTFDFDLKMNQGKLQDKAPLLLKELSLFCQGSFDPEKASMSFQANGWSGLHEHEWFAGTVQDDYFTYQVTITLG